MGQKQKIDWPDDWALRLHFDNGSAVVTLEAAGQEVDLIRHAASEIEWIYHWSSGEGIKQEIAQAASK